MNQVTLIGRTTRDVEVKYAANQTAIATLNIAINRGKDKDGNDKGADFINVKVFGKQGENCERYLSKGKLVAIQGRIQTGSYEKEGKKYYTTDVIADRVEFLEWGDKAQTSPQNEVKTDSVQKYYDDAVPMGFEQIDDVIPF